MVKKFSLYFALLALFAGLCVINNYATSRVLGSQPDWYFLSPHSYKNFRHIMGVGFGFRSLMADIDYISFLQYYGDKENIKTRWKDLYKYIDDITDADPNFKFVYTYGSAILAFNLGKYPEAIEVIKKGLKYNPAFWELRFYLGAIIYRQKGETEKYMALLEDAMKFENHPALIERLLGNIYENTKTPDEAALYWVKTYRKTKDRETRQHAYERLQLLIAGGKLTNPQLILKEFEGK